MIAVQAQTTENLADESDSTECEIRLKSIDDVVGNMRSTG